MKTKRCRLCEQVKPTSEFHLDKSAKDGYVAFCKGCKSEVDKQRRLNDPDSKRKSRENARKYREAHPEYANEWAKKWRRENPEKVRAKNKRYEARYPERAKAQKRKYQKRMAREIRNTKYMRQYGITLIDYEVMLESQGGGCAICSGAGKINLAVDHCHTTGKVRGLLCCQCNHLLGNANDDPTILANAIKYLTKE